MKKLIFGISFILLVAILISKVPIVRHKYQQVETKVQNVQDTIAPVPTKITSSGMPNLHQMRAVFVPQAPEKVWDQPWQDACEEAALLTVDYYYKNQQPTVQTIKSALGSLFDYEASQGWSHDVNITQMAQIGQHLGYQSKIVENPTEEDLKSYLSQNIPIIVPAAGKILYQENKYFKNGGPYYHNLVILGYDDRRKQFIVHDVGTQYGGYFHYSYDLLLESIHDFPASGKKEDIEIGDKKVLILLK